MARAGGAAHSIGAREELEPGSALGKWWEGIEDREIDGRGGVKRE